MKATIPKADLNDLRAFLAVVEEGSFSRAAKALGVPKSSVSRRVAHLEQELSAKLLQRTTRKLGLTDAGTLYFDRCRRAFEELSGAERCMEHLQEEPRGLLRITTPANFGGGYLNDLLEAYLARCPDVDVEVDMSNRFVDLIAEGFDVALRAGVLRDSSMVARRIGMDRLRLVASPTYLAKRGTPRTLSELGDHACLLFRSGGPAATWTLQGPRGAESVRVKGRISASDISLLHTAALRGTGVALLPWLTVRGAVERGDLVALLPEHASEPVPFSVVYPSAAHLTPKSRIFVEMAMEALRPLVE